VCDQVWSLTLRLRFGRYGDGQDDDDDGAAGATGGPSGAKNDDQHTDAAKDRARQQKQDSQRRAVRMEIIQTEKTYLKCLDVLTDQYVKPMRARGRCRTRLRYWCLRKRHRSVSSWLGVPHD